MALAFPTRSPAWTGRGGSGSPLQHNRPDEFVGGFSPVGAKDCGNSGTYLEQFTIGSPTMEEIGDWLPALNQASTSGKRLAGRVPVPFFRVQREREPLSLDDRRVGPRDELGRGEEALGECLLRQARLE
jgi:hypothetical protein